MQSPITFCTHGDAVSGVPSVVTFRHVQDMISTASEASAADFFFCVVAARRGAGALRAQASRSCRIFEKFPNASPAKKKAKLQFEEVARLQALRALGVVTLVF